MRYDPDRHHRRSIRLKGYNYGVAGIYFVTICTAGSGPLFGEILAGELHHNAYGRVAATAWAGLPEHFPHVTLGAWVVMPDHAHGLLVLTEGAPHPPQPAFRAAAAGSIGAIVGTYKSLVTRRINAMRQTPGEAVWQRGYFERVVRSEDERHRIEVYIAENPAKWTKQGIDPIDLW